MNEGALNSTHLIISLRKKTQSQPPSGNTCTLKGMHVALNPITNAGATCSSFLTGCQVVHSLHNSLPTPHERRGLFCCRSPPVFMDHREERRERKKKRSSGRVFFRPARFPRVIGSDGAPSPNVVPQAVFLLGLWWLASSMLSFINDSQGPTYYFSSESIVIYRTPEADGSVKTKVDRKREVKTNIPGYQDPRSLSPGDSSNWETLF